MHLGVRQQVGQRLQTVDRAGPQGSRFELFNRAFPHAEAKSGRALGCGGEAEPTHGGSSFYGEEASMRCG
jgi:hypothetical protein